MREKVKYRMYGLVPYNISPIQQGIQFGHAVVEYSIGRYGSHDDYEQWAKEDKTFIILDGGTTNDNEERLGSLNKSVRRLEDICIPYATFNEPDLGDQLTAVVFLVDDRVWDKEKYPEYDLNIALEGMGEITHYKNLFGEDATWVLEVREFLSNYRLA
tara:strand:- start:718 stop:1191 length:474 start_codon:yes stop_codon:yes gene_type:complete